MTDYKDRLAAGHYLPAPSPDDLEDSTIADLKDQLATRGLAVSGTKQELIDRLAKNSETKSENE